MASPRAFVSFDFDHDLKSKNLFAGQCTSKSPTPFTAEDWSSKDSLPQAEWERTIREKISNTHLLIVLVGRHMSSAGGVAKEIAMAKDLNVPIFGVYVDGAGIFSAVPAGLQRNRIADWTWQKVGAIIDQAMREGKNAR